jgi:hypothetical protein
MCAVARTDYVWVVVAVVDVVVVVVVPVVPVGAAVPVVSVVGAVLVMAVPVAAVSVATGAAVVTVVEVVALVSVVLTVSSFLHANANRRMASRDSIVRAFFIISSFIGDLGFPSSAAGTAGQRPCIGFLLGSNGLSSVEPSAASGEQ